MDQRRLVDRFGQVHSELFAHHMTIWTHHDGGDPRLEELPLGKFIALKIVGYAEDAKGQAVVVDPPSILAPRGRIPHITISTAAGVPPAYAKFLVRSAEARSGMPTVRGRVGWWDGENVRFDIP